MYERELRVLLKLKHTIKECSDELDDVVEVGIVGIVVTSRQCDQSPRICEEGDVHCHKNFNFMQKSNERDPKIQELKISTIMYNIM